MQEQSTPSHSLQPVLRCAPDHVENHILARYSNLNSFRHCIEPLPMVLCGHL